MESVGSKKLKIAFVSIRYGIEVNGGAELYCRQLSEKLVDIYDVEVLTTCAIDYVTWRNEYKAGYEIVNGVTVRRFKVDYPRDVVKFGAFTPKVLENGHSIEDEIRWMELQGPTSSELVRYISENQEKYSAILFIPYLYYTTYFGMQAAPEKSILIPAAHDEPYIYLEIFRSMFGIPKGIIFLTDEEKDFVHRLFHNEHIPNEVIGAGVDIPEDISGERFRGKYSIPCQFMLYIGRIDESKGCKELFDYFIEYKKKNRNDMKLVLMGKPVMNIPQHSDIISLGFISDSDKFDGIAASEMLVLPSQFESLSMVVLESMALGKPVIVNGHCKVTRGHCIKGNSGFYYMSYNEFEEYINLLLQNEKLKFIMGNNGFSYINEYYKWETVKHNLVSLISEEVTNIL